MGKHLPSDLMNPECLAALGVQSPSEVDVHYLVIRQRAKGLIQTRMLMVRYSAVMSETENRLAWGDR